MKHYAITIARSLGSDGGEVARRLAERLNIRFVDKELLEMASDESGISEALFNITDEKLNRRIFRKSTAAYSGEVYRPGAEDYLTQDNLFAIQSKILKDMIIKDEQSFVVVGRAANYVIGSLNNVFCVNIRASEEYCIENIMERNNISESEARKLIQKTNKYRANYYRYFTAQDWTDPANYDLTLNTSRLGITTCTELIIDALEKKFGETIPRF